MPAATPLIVTSSARRSHTSSSWRAFVLRSEPAQQLDLQQVDRIDVGIAHVDRAAQHRVVLEQVAVSGDVEHHVDGALQPRPQRRAEILLVRRHEVAIVVRGDIGVRLGERHLHQLDRRAEERPGPVHLAAGGAIRVARALPRRRATTAAAAASASRRTARGSRAAPAAPPATRVLPAGCRCASRRAPLRASPRGSTRGTAGRRKPSRGRRRARATTAAPSSSRQSASAGGGVGERRLERRRGVDLERAERDAGQAELRLDHLALFGHAQRAVDRSRRLRSDREVRRAAAAADAAAAAVKERDRHAVCAAGRDDRFLRLVELPGGRQASRRPWPSRSSRPSLPAGPRCDITRSRYHGIDEQRVDHRRRGARDRARSRTAARRVAAAVTPASRCSSSTASTSDGRPAIVMT